MVKKLLAGLACALFLAACAGVKSDDPDAINDALVGFTTCAQSARWSEALQYVTPSEAKQISENGTFKEEYQKAAQRLPLSTMRRMQWTVDGEGRLVGIKAVMDEANERYVVSEGQSQIGTKDYFDKQEKKRIESRLEEGRKLMEEEETRPEQQVEVMSNKLTDEEKRKYGSTGDLQAPEEYEDAQTRAADEAFYGNSDSSSESSSEPDPFAEEGYYGE